MEKPSGKKRAKSDKPASKIKKAKPQPAAEFAKWKPFPVGAKVHTPEQRINPALARVGGYNEGFARLKRLPPGFRSQSEYNEALQWIIAKRELDLPDEEHEYYRENRMPIPQAYHFSKRSPKSGKWKHTQMYGDPRDLDRQAYAAGRP